MGIRRRHSGFLTFAGGTLGGKHTLAVNLNSLDKADSPDFYKNILLAEFSK
ncbi:D-alanyl-D-alanine carboxypeptidase [Bacillus mycoides]|nr:D-alanyl-D-alanine carboxypeptidase [Bacillus mycoides]